MVMYEIHQRFKGHFLGELRVSLNINDQDTRTTSLTVNSGHRNNISMEFLLNLIKQMQCFLNKVFVGKKTLTAVNFP